MTPDDRADLEALARDVEPPCGFVLTGYGPEKPCRRSEHPPRSFHDCGGVIVVAA